KSLGAAGAADSKDIVNDAPQIAETGAVVPVEITSNLPNTRSIVVLIEKNPFPLAAKFDFLDGAVPFVKVNVKIGESSNVRVLAEAGGRYYAAVKEVKVTIGGCGG
ncbi:MAG: thiosulfate oxidation carrier protein SoxY, partial [Burkholderiales bacterium]